MTHGVEQPGDGDPARNKVSTPTTTEIIAEVRSQLIGPGGAFEVVTEPVGGIGQPGPIDMLVYANRLAHLREVFAFAAAHGDATFIVYGERRITFSQFVADANRVAANLATLGVGHGDRVAVLSQNNPEWCLTFWATVNLGAILVGLNGWWNTDEILFGLSDSGAKILVADPKRLARVSGSLDGLPDLQQVVVIGARDPNDQSDSVPVRPFADLLAGGIQHLRPHHWPKPTPPSSSTPRGPQAAPRVPSRHTAAWWPTCKTPCFH